MDLELDNLQAKIKRKYSFKYKPEFTESFQTEIKENQIIPLTIEVFDKLDWPIVYTDINSVEAKRKGDWNKLTEKITITKKASGRIEVHSKTIEGNFIDFGKNSLRTGLFIAVFQKLATEYNANGKLVEIETEFTNQNNWVDYEIPTELPEPNKFNDPNLTQTILGAILIAISFGTLIAFLTVKFAYFIGIYEFGLGLGIGYFFGKVLRKTNYMEFKSIQFITGSIMVLMFVTNQFTQYLLIISEHNLQGLGFFDFMKMRFNQGLNIKELNTGWIGLILSWIFQLVLPYYLALGKIGGILAQHSIEKIPEEVLEYTIYLFDMDKSESEVRTELASKGWNKKSDQDDVFQAIAEINEFQQMVRE